MNERRKPAGEVSPDYEDRGIFSTRMVQLSVDLVPIHGRNSRQDIMIKAYLAEGQPIDVVFAGRRSRKAMVLLNRLNMLWQQARARARARPAGDGPMPDEVRLRITLEGCWRPRFDRDDQGWQTRQMQLYAARWALLDADGKSVTYGEPVRR